MFMGQLIACATGEGVLIGTDSRAEFFEPGGAERFITVNRLMPLTSHAALASAGNWEAADICKEFASFARNEGITDINGLIDAAIPYFTGKYDEILRKMCEKMPPDPVVNMYLLLAGYDPKAKDDPSRLFIIWDRPQPPKIEYNKVTNIFTLPRRLGLEYKLNQLVQQKAPLSKVVAEAKAGMAKLASQDESIGPPYSYVTVTAAGLTNV
jgi:hypothetical protein